MSVCVNCYHHKKSWWCKTQFIFCLTFCASMSWIMSIMHDNTPLQSPKHVSVLAMNFSSHCCVCLNLGQNGHWMSRNHHWMKKIRFLKGSCSSLTCLFRKIWSFQWSFQFLLRDHHKTISYVVAQCGLYLASRLNIYWRVFTVSALCKTNYVSHGSRGALTSPHSLGVVSHKHTNILKTSSAAGWGLG